MFLPAVLVNSPYAGEGWGNGTIPEGYPAGPGQPNHTAMLGGGAINGTMTAVFFSVGLTIEKYSNASFLGYGSNTPCSQPYQVIPHSEGADGPVGWPVAVPTNISDEGEATTVNLSASFSGDPGTPTWANGFVTDNAPTISTCGASGRNVSVISEGLTLWISFALDRVNETVRYVLPFAESFHYYFPPNFGTWAIDNLSTPKGPGGGWAFDYLGSCS